MIVEVQNASKEKAEDRTCSTDSHAIIFRERVANRFQRVSIRHQLVKSIVHDLDHELESRSFEMKSDQSQEEKEKWASEIEHFSRIFVDFATNRVKKQHEKSSRQKLVNEQCDHEFEEHEESTASQFDESTQIRKQMTRECERVNRDR